jgi:vacuolar protein sorting-associated protein 8
VLNSQIRQVPPRITQRLVVLHDEEGRPDLVEQVIWHIDPANLDISQAIQLCQEHQLYNALIYIYTRTMRDYLSPVVELLTLIRRMHQYRKSRGSAADAASQVAEDVAIGPVAMHAYKIYSYLVNILSGLSYPSEEPLSEDEAFQAKKDIYSFLFLGRSRVWPVGDGGKLVLIADEDGGVEPTFPYTRTLLRFDPESFLHSLDIAFEDGYLNDQAHTHACTLPCIVPTVSQTYYLLRAFYPYHLENPPCPE